ncbi:MAG TPA: hypothetical protein PKY88_12810 [Anaerohalosphaeraceae bacterium]|nr:hypothetical protein [Anaerohalosphaeraceae bacterium]
MSVSKLDIHIAAKDTASRTILSLQKSVGSLHRSLGSYARGLLGFFSARSLVRGVKTFALAVAQHNAAAEHAFEGMKGALGSVKEEAMNAFAPVFYSVFEGIRGFIETNKKAIVKWAQSISGGFSVAITLAKNFKDVLALSLDSIMLAAVKTWEALKHFFVNALPEYMKWFGRNWKNLFIDSWNFLKTVLLNMYENLKNFFTAVWNFLSGEDFTFQWRGLLEGFESTLEALPEIAERKITDVEREISSRIASNPVWRKLIESGKMPDIQKAAEEGKETKKKSRIEIRKTQNVFESLTAYGAPGKTWDQRAAEAAEKQNAKLDKLIRILEKNERRRAGGIAEIEIYPAMR